MADVNEGQRERPEMTAAQHRALEFDKAFDAIANGVFIVDADGLIVRANRVAVQIFGLEPDCKHWWDQLVPLNVSDSDERPLTREEMPIGRALRGETVRNVPLTVTALSGERRSVLATATPVYRAERLIGAVAVWNDVTERERALDAVRQRDELLDYAHVVIRDMDSRIVFWNQGVERLYGWTKDEALGQVSHNLFQTEFPVSSDAILTQLLAKDSWEGELVQTKRDGSRMVVASHQVLHRDASGRPIGILEVNNDVTALKQAQEAIQASRDELEERVRERTAELWNTNEALRVASAYNRSLLEASLDPLVTIGPDGKITDVNRATERATGYERQQLIGTDFSDYFTEPERARAAYQRVFRDGFVRDYALELRHRNGHLDPVLYNATIYRDEHDQVAGVFAAARDITELKQAEFERETALEALRVAGAYNRSLLEASLDPLVTIGPDGKITDVNRATERATGYERQQLIGTDFSDYFTEPEKARAGYKQVYRDGLVRDYSLELRHRDGHVNSVLYNASVYLDENGEVIGVFAAARDITERKRAEEEIRKLNEELEERVHERTAELEAFAYSVSHDLRAPLRAIDGYTKMLVEDLPLLDAESQRKFNAIRLNAVKMGQLIDGLLTFSRLGRAGINIRTIDMTCLAQEAWSELRQAWPDDAIQLDLGTLPPANGDYSLIRQVLVNLLSNSIKFSRPKGNAQIKLDGHVENRETVYCVQDHGVGFDMKYADKLFGVFQRLHSEQEFEGTGIGLALVQQIIHRHGGRVWAEAKEGEGAAFYFSLPGVPQV